MGTRVVIRATDEAIQAATELADYTSQLLTRMVATPTPAQVIAARPTQSPPEYWYAASNVNARSCAATNCEVVTVISRGTRIEVIGQEQGQAVSGNTLWLITEMDGKTAYIHRSTVLNSPPPAENAPPRPTSVPAVQQQVQQQQQQPPPLTPTPVLQSEPVLPPVIQPPPAASACDCHSGNTLNCPDFRSQAAAQACHNQCMAEVGRDVHGLDGNDNDGLACESLP